MQNSNVIFKTDRTLVNFKTFHNEKFFTDLMESLQVSDIWGLLRKLIPDEAWNIVNYQLIQDKFRWVPDNTRILDAIEASDLYCLVGVNTHELTTGCEIVIFPNDSAIGSPQITNYVTSKGSNSFSIQEYTNPDVEAVIGKFNPFRFYNTFSRYVALNGADNARRTFTLAHEFTKESGLTSIAKKRNIVWRGISFELSWPTHSSDRSKYHIIAPMVEALKDNKAFFLTFTKLTNAITGYVNVANNDHKRTAAAMRFIPLAYTESEKLMRELRKTHSLLQMKASDFDSVFTPYLEVGDKVEDFVFGVVSK